MLVQVIINAIATAIFLHGQNVSRTRIFRRRVRRVTKLNTMAGVYDVQSLFFFIIFVLFLSTYIAAPFFSFFFW